MTSERPRLAMALDVLVVLFLLALSRRGLVGHEGTVRLTVLHAALVLPLLFRRRAPELVFAVMALIAFVQWLFFHPLPADISLLIALYTVAAQVRLPRAALSAGVLQLGVMLAVFDHPVGGGRVLGFVFLTGLVAAAMLLGVNVRVRRQRLAEAEERAARLERERDQQAQLAAAEERARMAREMHDVVAHNLAVMIALTDGAKLTVRSDPDRAELALEGAGEAGRAALADLRRVLGVLRSPTAEPDRAPSPDLHHIDDLIDAVRQTGLDVRFRTAGPFADLPPALQLNVYRVVQEALTNVMKHAVDARSVSVDVAVRDDRVEVEVRDDGRTPVAAATTGQHHGLIGMQERARLHDGAVTAGPTPTGWSVQARFAMTPVTQTTRGA